ncbi:MAG: hypothetical protein ACK47B_16870 [Armatimonadota bacterium]
MKHLTSLGAAAMLLVAATAAAQAPAGETMPRNWFAFVARTGGPQPAGVRVHQASPEVILFKDGRIIWRTTPERRRETADQPVQWREGKVPQEAMVGFSRLFRSSPFFTTEPPALDSRLPGGRPAPGQAPRIQLPTTHFGVALADRSRVAQFPERGFVEEESPEGEYVREVRKLENALLGMRPLPGKPVEAEVIRVGFFRADADPNAPAWPLSDQPEVTQAGFTYYAGEEARKVRQTFDGKNRTRVGTVTLQVEWAPAIEVPRAVVQGG